MEEQDEGKDRERGKDRDPDKGQDKGQDKGKKPYRKLDWRYTETRRRKFLRVLAETYDIEAACDAGEMTWSQVCELRVRHPSFAARFEEVIVAGYDRLEASLLRHSGVAGKGPIDPALAQALLKQRRMGRAEAGGGVRGGGKGSRAAPPRQEMMQAIVDRLAPLKAAHVRGSKGNGAAKGPAQEAVRGAGGARRQ